MGDPADCYRLVSYAADMTQCDSTPDPPEQIERPFDAKIIQQLAAWHAECCRRSREVMFFQIIILPCNLVSLLPVFRCFPFGQNVRLS